MISEPRLEERPAQPYVARRTQVPMQELGTVIPQLHSEVYTWWLRVGVSHWQAHRSFATARIDMPGRLDIEPGSADRGGGGQAMIRLIATITRQRVGRYATLIYTDVRRGIEGNTALLDWGAQQGFKWDS